MLSSTKTFRRSKRNDHLMSTLSLQPTSGGAFEPYKNLLHGEKHTIYPETYSSLGTAAMEYAEASAGRGVFSPPQGIRTNLPEGLPHARMVVTSALHLDASGNLKGIRVLEAGPARDDRKSFSPLLCEAGSPATRDARQPASSHRDPRLWHQHQRPLLADRRNYSELKSEVLKSDVRLYSASSRPSRSSSSCPHVDIYS